MLLSEAARAPSNCQQYLDSSTRVSNACVRTGSCLLAVENKMPETGCSFNEASAEGLNDSFFDFFRSDGESERSLNESDC